MKNSTRKKKKASPKEKGEGIVPLKISAAEKDVSLFISHSR